jgi:WhiB family transcriptional regulator, redox-sensing transcriptional regulator
MAGWWDRAACRELRTAVFFPGQHDPFATAAAKRICERCAVRADCAAYASARPELQGIWGATTALERNPRRRGGADRDAGAG